MILQSLYEYYQRLAQDPKIVIAGPGYSMVKVDFAFVLSSGGELVHILPLFEMDGTRKIAAKILVPVQIKRASNISANFLCDKAEYVLGISEDRPDRAKRAHQAFVDLHRIRLTDTHDEGAAALIAFFERAEYTSEHPLVFPYWEQMQAGGNIVFMLQGETQYLHDRPDIRLVIENASAEDTPIAQCLITGMSEQIARLHPSIKGVADAQSSGASIVSFNQESFTSYGKSQSYNAPVSQRAAFAYTTVLNHLLSDDSRRMRIGDATTVFWTDQPAEKEERVFGSLFGFDKDQFAKSEDPEKLQIIRSVIDHLRSGRKLGEDIDVDDSVGFHVLGLSPNASRLSIRFYFHNTLGAFVEKLGRHYEDADILKNAGYRPQFPSIWHMLKEVAVRRDLKNVPNSMISSITNSLLIGTNYPQSLYTGVLSRIRADHEVNATRAGILKACLVRSHRFTGLPKEKEMIVVSLNLNNTNPGYLLGRLFSVLEKAQGEAIGSATNATIRDRYMSAAAATPSAVFPQLLRLANHHIRKLSRKGIYYDRLIQGILNDMDGDAGLPKTMNSEEQGLFYIGYYQQRQDLYTAKADK